MKGRGQCERSPGFAGRITRISNNVAILVGRGVKRSHFLLLRGFRVYTARSTEPFPILGGHFGIQKIEVGSGRAEHWTYVRMVGPCFRV